jgi:replicative DNA helicase
MRSSAAARMRRDETQGVLGVRTPPHSIEAEQAVLGGLPLESFASDNELVDKAEAQVFEIAKAGSLCQRI